MVTLGSPIIQDIRNLLSREGSVAESILRGPHPVPSALPASMRGMGITLKLDKIEVRYRSIARIQFRATLDGFERAEEFFPVVLDCQSLSEASSDLEDLLDAGKEDQARGTYLPLREQPLLTKAFEVAENRIKPLVRKFEEEAEAEATREKQLAEAYYDGLMRAEPNRRGELQGFKAKQLQDIDQRYAIRADLEPRTVILYRVPYARAQILAERGPSSHSFVLNYDPFAGRWQELQCPAHPDRPMFELTHCPDHGLACKKCYWECQVCDRARCSQCLKSRCSGCQESHCPDCVVSCNRCRKTFCPTTAAECTSGCGWACIGCQQELFGEIYCKKCVVAADCGHLELQKKLGYCTVGKETLCADCTAASLTACTACRKVACNNHLLSCAEDGGKVCPSCAITLRDGSKACPSHAGKCGCGRLTLRSALRPCPEHAFSCSVCAWTCSCCQKIGCLGCKVTQCEGCSSPHCENCVVVCASCSLSYCQKTTRECPTGCGRVCSDCEVLVGERIRCRVCVVTTTGCHHTEVRENLVVCSVENEQYCLSCAPLQTTTCGTCGFTVCLCHSGPCALCQVTTCYRCSPEPLAGGGRGCPKHAAHCSCGSFELKKTMVNCPEHDRACPRCRWTCKACSRTCCSSCERVLCEGCGENHCTKCVVLCSDCGKSFCKKTTKVCEGGCGPVCPECIVEHAGAPRCRKCLTVAATCKHREAREAVVVCPLGNEEYCRTCATALVRSCSECRQEFCPQHVGLCGGAEHLVCDGCAPERLEDGRRACSKHADHCVCGHYTLTTRFADCEAHGRNCPKCAWKCDSCSRTRCSRCPKVACSVCKREHCADCVVRCVSCRSLLCQKSTLTCTSCGLVCPSCAYSANPTHPMYGRTGLSKWQVSGSEVACKKCSEKCDCGHWTIASKASLCRFGESFCPTCAAKSLGVCHTCGRSCCINHSEPCAGGGEPLCEDCPANITDDNQRACARHSARCGCGRIRLLSEVAACDLHVGSCKSCEWHCNSCSSLGCSQCQQIPCAAPGCRAQNCAKCVEPCRECAARSGQGMRSPELFCKTHRCADCAQQLGCVRHRNSCSNCQQMLCGSCLKGSVCAACQAFRPANPEEREKFLQFRPQLERLNVPMNKPRVEVSPVPALRTVYRLRSTLNSWIITIEDQKVRVTKNNAVGRFFGLRGKEL